MVVGFHYKARNKIFSQTSNYSLSLSQLATSLCPIISSQNSQDSQQQQSSQPNQSSQANQSSEANQTSQPNQSSQQQKSSRQGRNKRTLDSGIVTMQPTTSTAEPTIDPPPKKKTRKGRSPFEIYLGTKPLSAGEANQSRIVSSRRHSIEVKLNYNELKLFNI